MLCKRERERKKTNKPENQGLSLPSSRNGQPRLQIKENSPAGAARPNARLWSWSANIKGNFQDGPPPTPAPRVFRLSCCAQTAWPSPRLSHKGRNSWCRLARQLLRENLSEFRLYPNSKLLREGRKGFLKNTRADSKIAKLQTRKETSSHECLCRFSVIQVRVVPRGAFSRDNWTCLFFL